MLSHNFSLWGLCFELSLNCCVSRPLLTMRRIWLEILVHCKYIRYNNILDESYCDKLLSEWVSYFDDYFRTLLQKMNQILLLFGYFVIGNKICIFVVQTKREMSRNPRIMGSWCFSFFTRILWDHWLSITKGYQRTTESDDGKKIDTFSDKSSSGSKTLMRQNQSSIAKNSAADFLNSVLLVQNYSRKKYINHHHC